MYLYALYFVSSTSVVNWWSAQGAAWTLWPIFHMECQEKWGWLVNAKQASQIFTPAMKKICNYWVLLSRVQGCDFSCKILIAATSIERWVGTKYFPIINWCVAKKIFLRCRMCPNPPFVSQLYVFFLPANCRLQFKSCVHKLDVISILNTIGYNKASRYLLFSIWLPCNFGVGETSSVHICIFDIVDVGSLESRVVRSANK